MVQAYVLPGIGQTTGRTSSCVCEHLCSENLSIQSVYVYDGYTSNNMIQESVGGLAARRAVRHSVGRLVGRSGLTVGWAVGLSGFGRSDVWAVSGEGNRVV